MAKNISIKEGNTEKQFSGVAKLRTKKVGGGTCDWVVQDELGRKTVTANGTYYSDSDGLYGYERFTVAIPNAESMQF